MKELLININTAFESKARLGIMSVLMVTEQIDINSQKEMLDLTDGNLASHLKALEEQAYIAVHKQFIGRKPNTTYQATQNGKKAFEAHLTALENLIKGYK